MEENTNIEAEVLPNVSTADELMREIGADIYTTMQPLEEGVDEAFANVANTLRLMAGDDEDKMSELLPAALAAAALRGAVDEYREAALRTAKALYDTLSASARIGEEMEKALAA